MIHRTLAAVLLAGAAASCRPEAAEATRQYGFALPAWTESDYSSPRAPAYVASLAATGARWIQFTPTWYQRTTEDSTIRRTEETASDESLRGVIALAEKHRLKVLLKPHVDLPGDEDRAEIRPKDRAEWFASYRAFITHYAKLAASAGVDQLAVGTELAGVSGHRAEWLAVISDVRDAFAGELVYAANYDAYQSVAFWDEVDLIGIDAYWPLASEPTGSVEELKQAWDPHAAELSALSAAHGKKILFTEAGYTSQRGTVTEPYSWTVSAVRDDREQAAAYEALLATFSTKAWWAGVMFWMWDDWPGSESVPRPLAYTPHGKPAEKVARRYFTR
ncbi:glycoside hydrolase family 113 [Actinocorallia libanotica]|uniref:GTA TIM-barrel-like domain-containing protein n=1 Tax=Actinocorallia libanotica TaxID=46162 RepID=A0ABN1RPQ2_9ACTN